MMQKHAKSILYFIECVSHFPVAKTVLISILKNCNNISPVRKADKQSMEKMAERSVCAAISLKLTI